MRRANRAGDPIELRTLGLALLASLLLWNLPFGGVLSYPFKLLATWLHELSHGVMMIATGAGFDHVVIYRDTSGLAYAQHSVAPFPSALIAAAGYMGTPLWGALLLVLTPNARRARYAMIALAGLLVATGFTVVDSRTETFGQWAIASMGGVVAACALFLPGRWRVLFAHFIAAQACVNALLDIRVLLRPSQVVDGLVVGASDAHNMAKMTFGTTETWAVWTWALIWLAWSLAVLFIALRISGSRAEKSASWAVRATAAPRDGSDRDERRRSPATAPGETDPSGPADTAGP